jgi:hypothetical protein
VFAVWKIKPEKHDGFDDYIYTYTLAGCVGIVKKWLNDDTMKYTPHDFSALIYALNEKGINNSLKKF